MNKLFTAFCLLFLVSLFKPAYSQTQHKFFVYFTDKANSPYSIDKPEAFLSQKALTRRKRQKIAINSRDLPVNPSYVSGIRQLGVYVVYKSKWFNGAMLFCDSSQLVQVLQLPYLKKQSQVLSRVSQSASKYPKFEKEQSSSNLRTTASRSNYGKSYNQANMIGATAMHDAGFKGEGMTIAVFDAGFPGVNTVAAFAPLFNENRVKGVYDFVDNDSDVYKPGKSSHGTQTLSCIGAYQPGDFIGTAYKADFYLFITENAQSEQHSEEINWLLAAEYADSAGVDVISSSLGYTEFDPPSASYEYKDMNGKTAISTKAADLASSTGMLVVNSAGNEGNTGWHYLSAPSDGDSVLAVGAVDSLGIKTGFSSFGPSADNRLKPNLADLGGMAAVVLPNGLVAYNNGTSFSCPILAGMAAGFWQANPFMTNMQVLEYLQRSGTQASRPDNNLGYGIPNFSRAQQLTEQNFPTEKEVVLYPNPIAQGILNFSFIDARVEGPVHVKIFDRLGKVVDEAELTKEINEPFSMKLRPGLAAGLYFTQVSWAGNVKTSRLLVLQH